METQEQQVQESSKRREGQTLAEFALTLPILLLLLFGIVEFGRIFQAWVTVQNAARVAARYASTGQWDEDRYGIGAGINMTDIGLETQIDPVPYVNCNRDVIPSSNTNFINLPQIDGSADRQVEWYDRQPSDATLSEHVFKSWYGVSDCDPNEETLQQRKDMMRLISIYEEARRGAAGLSIEPNQVSPNHEAIENFFRRYHFRPSFSPDGGTSWRHERGSWFDVTVCSTRPRIFPEGLSEVIDPNTGNAYPPAEQAAAPRFHTVLDAFSGMNENLEPAACLLMEHPTSGGDAQGMSDNVAIPWADPGGSGDRVTVVVTFNHPLITPLPLADFIQIQARRSAVNESFRVSNAERALGPAGATGGTAPEITPEVTPEATAEPSATHTYTPTATSTVTETSTPIPFDCANIYVRSLEFRGNRFFIDFENGNADTTFFERAVIHWQPDDFQPDYPDINMLFMALDNEIIWQGDGTQNITPVDSNLYPDSEPGFFFGEWTVLGNQAVTEFNGVFASGPPLLFEYTDLWAFSGTTFYFTNLKDETNPCAILLEMPPEPPTDTPTPEGWVPTATYTPDCASSTMNVEFVSFDPLGDVRLRVTNNRSVISPMFGALIYFQEHPGLGLARIVAGGSNANDIITNGGTGQVIWEAGVSTGVSTSPVNTYTDGIWQQDFGFPANSITDLHLDFTGAGASTLPGSIPGYDRSMFNGTMFDISCGGGSWDPTGGGGTGGGGNGGNWGSSGSIFLFNNPTPAPTSPPQPTRTPGPTATPSNTPLPVTPSPTRTPRPATETLTPSDTPPASPTFTPSPTFDFTGGGGQG